MNNSERTFHDFLRRLLRYPLVHKENEHVRVGTALHKLHTRKARPFLLDAMEGVSGDSDIDENHVEITFRTLKPETFSSAFARDGKVAELRAYAASVVGVTPDRLRLIRLGRALQDDSQIKDVIGDGDETTPIRVVETKSGEDATANAQTATAAAERRKDTSDASDQQSGQRGEEDKGAAAGSTRLPVLSHEFWPNLDAFLTSYIPDSSARSIMLQGLMEHHGEWFEQAADLP